MDILWFGETCFRLQATQATILTDPFGVALPASAATAEIVTLSQREMRGRLLAQEPYRLVDGPGEYEIRGVTISGVATRLAVPEGEPAGDSGAEVATSAARTFVYSLNLDGLVVTHLGRLNRAPSAAEVQQLGSPDVLLIPLGEPAGLPVAPAVALASQLEAKMLVPVLVSTAADRGALERFCRELGADPTNLESRLTVTSSGLPAQARVTVLAAPEA